jgi:hypothetical protein
VHHLHEAREAAMKRGRFEYIEEMVGKPPEGWTLDTTVLREAPDEIMCEVECWRRDALAVHEVWIFALSDNGVPLRKITLGRITHKRTGFRIADFTSLDDAVIAAELIEGIAPWREIKCLKDAAPHYFKVLARLEKAFVKGNMDWMTVFRPVEQVHA